MRDYLTKIERLSHYRSYHVSAWLRGKMTSKELEEKIEKEGFKISEKGEDS